MKVSKVYIYRYPGLTASLGKKCSAGENEPREAMRKRQRKPLVTLDLTLAIIQKRAIQTRGSESLGRRLVNTFANMQINLIGSYNCYLPRGR